MLPHQSRFRAFSANRGHAKTLTRHHRKGQRRAQKSATAGFAGKLEEWGRFHERIRNCRKRGERLNLSYMSVTTIDIPLENLPGMPAREGLRFTGIVHDGTATISIQVTDSNDPLSGGEEEAQKRSAAEHFFTEWSGKGALLPQEEIDKDPRLAYLTAKHIR